MKSTYAVKLTRKAENYVNHGHPWVFSDGIVKISDEAKTGDLTVIFSQRNNKMIGIGLFDETSPLRIKMIYNGRASVTIDSEFFREKIEIAYSKRQRLLDTNTNSYRLVFGENDGFPSFIADVYANVLVVKLYSEIWLPYFGILIGHLRDISSSDTVVLRLSRHLQKSNTHNFKDGQVVDGHLANEVVHFVEHGVNFSANVIKGHKTGYFLDHRENRRLVGLMSEGKTVLDVFSYTGGFSVHALVNGATEVTSLDISKQALQIAEKNAHLNTIKGKHHTIVGDAFKALKQLIADGKTYEVVIIDPPSFAKQQAEVEIAKKKYGQLAKLGASLTAHNGLLVLASCSSRISAQTFFDINAHNLKLVGRRFTIINKTQHDVDHPIGFQEGAYLKCGYYHFH